MTAVPAEGSGVFETCYLHIGTEKTGSTTLQRFLAENRARLAEAGYFYPAAFGLPNQIGLAVYAGAPDRLGPLMFSAGVRRAEDLPEFRKSVERKFREEVAGAGDCRFLVLSNEHLHSRLRTEREIGALRDMLAQFCRRIEVVVYLRRQDLVAASLASTLYKAGRTAEWKLPPTRGRPPYYYDYAAVIRNYAGVFGAENCRPRLFERQRLVNGDVVEDFASVIGLDLSPALVRPRDENKSVTLLGQALLAELNKHAPPYVEGRRNPLRGNLDAVISDHHAGRAALMTRSQAEEFYRAFRDGNAEVKRLYFPELGRETLFDEDFSNYPERLEEESYSFAQGCEAAGLLWRDRMQVIQTQSRRLGQLTGTLEALRADIRALVATGGTDARDAGASALAAALFHAGDVTAATEFAERIAAARPGDPAPRLLLGRILLGQGKTGRALDRLREAAALEAEPGEAATALVETLARAERAGAALDFLRPALERHPGSQVLLRLKAQLEASNEAAPSESVGG